MKNRNFWKIVCYSAIVCLFTSMSAWMTTADAADSFGDPFDGGKLQNSGWKWQNEPAAWDVGTTREGFLYMDSETGRNVWASDDSHLLYQETDVDMFDVETHFFAKWNTNSGVNGLIVKSPGDNNWVTLKFWSRDSGNRGHIQFQRRQAGMGPSDAQWRFGDWGDIELSLRLKKEGDVYTAWYKAVGDEEWVDIGQGTFTLNPPLWLGIYAGVADPTGNLGVGYEYFHDNINPVAVEPENKVTTTWGMVKSRY